MNVILASVDFSDATEQVVATAKALAMQTGASVVLTHVIQPIPHVVAYGNSKFFQKAVQEIEERAHEGARQKLHTLIEALDPIRVVGSKVFKGDVAERIMDESERLGVDLVIIGTHGKRAFNPMELGSSSAKILRSCRKPVLVVPTLNTEN